MGLPGARHLRRYLSFRTAAHVRKLNPQMSASPVLTGMEILVEYDRSIPEDHDRTG
jgi:hypothetical protein